MIYNYSMNIVLIGMPGCGKSTIGRELSKKLSMNFIDMDEYIEKTAGCTIPEIFEKGEEHFRNIESEAVNKLSKEKSCIIATGGGVVKKASNMFKLKENGVIIYINRPIKNIMMDLDITNRPLLRAGVKNLYEIYNERFDLYKKYSHIEVDNSENVNDIIDKIISILQLQSY